MGRRTGTLVGVRADSGRLPEAGDLRTGTLHGRSDPDGLDAGGTRRRTGWSSDGYIELSGTSFAAPVISGLAAQVLARNPSWTPDQVKSALMRRARPVPQSSQRSCGVGQVNAVQSVLATPDTPNPNEALNRFLRTAADGSTVFDAVSWTDVSWSDVSWDAVSWSDVSWSDVSWDAVSWSDVSWTDVSWSDVSWTDVSWEDNADGETPRDGNGYELTPAQSGSCIRTMPPC